jgi:threonine synthase
VKFEVPALVCSGCGDVAPDDDPYPFRCPNADRDDDIDHVLVRAMPSIASFPQGAETNPFVGYRDLSRSYHLARTNGIVDSAYVDIVERFDKEVAGVDGRGFVETPFARAAELSDRVAVEMWVKDETGNVSGSHKARHLFGLLVHLRVVDELGWTSEPPPDLAIASCGNAALAAAVVARAGGRTLRVFVPTSADPVVVDRLGSLGAHIEVYPREAGVPGDPTYHALERAIADGALPFTCQGNQNGLSIEGAHTIGYEMASTLAADGVSLDRIFIQVGGGALASAVMAAFAEAQELGVIERLPRFHAVQTVGGFPLKRAYDRLLERIGVDDADELRERFDDGEVQDALTYAARHRSEFMWPWEEEPKSVAHGILDDETYDWLAVVRGMLRSGGTLVVVDEVTLERANALGREATGIDVDHTGSAGLAGLIALREQGDVGRDERVAVVFTGARRHPKEER